MPGGGVKAGWPKRRESFIYIKYGKEMKLLKSLTDTETTHTEYKETQKVLIKTKGNLDLKYKHGDKTQVGTQS